MADLERIPRLGGLLGIKTAPVVERVLPLVGSSSGPLVATIPHTFNALSITCRVPRETARTICPWLDALAGDEIALELGAAFTVAHSDEAALPTDAPALVRSLGDDVAAVSWDGEAWTYALEQANGDEAAVEATIARFDAVASALAVTEAQRRIGARLHRAVSRSMPSRIWVRARGGELDPIVGLAWDRVEWLPIQHMMAGFYPQAETETKIARLSRNSGIEHATVELVCGPADPPGMRLVVQVDELA